MIKELQGENAPLANPFDTICYYGLELARCMIFGGMRYRTDLKYLGDYTKDIETWTDKINESKAILDSLPDDIVEDLRATSRVSKSDLFHSMNDSLLKLEKGLKTEYSACVPVVSEDYIKLVYDEEDAKKLISRYKFLADIIEMLITKHGVEKATSLLHTCSNYVGSKGFERNTPDVDSVIWILTKIGDATESDIDYMISYIS